MMIGMFENAVETGVDTKSAGLEACMNTHADCCVTVAAHKGLVESCVIVNPVKMHVEGQLL